MVGMRLRKTKKHGIWLFCSIVCLSFLAGCLSRSEYVRRYHSPTEREITNPHTLSDSELRQISTCEYWGVCRYSMQEELKVFGPNFLYQGRLKYVPKETCHYEECDRLEEYHLNPVPINPALIRKKKGFFTYSEL